ncbi:MAG: beta-ketoacyl-ACP synthase II [Sediminibacterium magnilacihabitans]|jgi:3-oxoacyl-[acyl-carrier-protein] synthase II|nr:beta-ketoacyl-ACP synthase II [Sediminibacterium magnilacihabitans]PQV62113.1 3-oxoacyl-[acyl-carrier-protein] synthase II [Sediminibacterium magnilacihabitans]
MNLKNYFHRVVVTGIGAVTPLGNNAITTWRNLLAGYNGIGTITKFDTTLFKTKFAAEVKEFDPLKYFEKGEIRKYDLFTQYAVAAVDEALSMATLDKIDRDEVGVIWGSGNGGIQTFQEQMLEFAEGNRRPRFNPFFVPKMIADIPSGVISIRYGLHGINFSTISACASSNNAIIDAYHYIKLGKAKMIISGGSEAAINEASVGGFNASKALSQKNNICTTACRPFDIARDGFVIGEGAGALVLESLESAVERDAKILAEIVGTGMAADAFHLTGTHPDGKGAYLGMKRALDEAGLNPGQIDCINAHATSTPMGDISELKAIHQLFGTNQDLTICATKSATGHLLGAAGAVESIFSVLSLENNMIPKIYNTENIESPFDQYFHFVLKENYSKQLRYVLNNTFGFGGHIATTLFKKWEDE